MAGSVAQDAAALFTLKSQPREVKNLAQRAELELEPSQEGRECSFLVRQKKREENRWIKQGLLIEREGRRRYIPHESKAELPVQRSSGYGSYEIEKKRSFRIDPAPLSG